MPKTVIVSEDRWRDAIKFLTGRGVNPSLSPTDQRKLRQALRGPFAKGMPEVDAQRFLSKGLGWKKQGA